MRRHTIRDNLRRWDREHRWPQHGDEWAGQARGQSYESWKRSVIETFLVPHVTAESVVLEIAPGHGRWSRELAPRCKTLILVDLSPSCVEHCRALFADQRHVRCILTDGRTLPDVDDGSVDFVWSYDSFVHMDPETIDAYLGEIRRVLRPGGTAIIHHAGRSHATLRLGFLLYLGWLGRVLYNLVSMRSVADGWRSNVSARRLSALARDHQLVVEAQVQTWGARNEYGVRRFGDYVTTLRKGLAELVLALAAAGCAAPLTLGGHGVAVTNSAHSVRECTSLGIMQEESYWGGTTGTQIGYDNNLKALRNRTADLQGDTMLLLPGAPGVHLTTTTYAEAFRCAK